MAMSLRAHNDLVLCFAIPCPPPSFLPLLPALSNACLLQPRAQYVCAPHTITWSSTLPSMPTAQIPSSASSSTLKCLPPPTPQHCLSWAFLTHTLYARPRTPPRLAKLVSCVDIPPVPHTLSFALSHLPTDRLFRLLQARTPAGDPGPSSDQHLRTSFRSPGSCMTFTLP